MREWERIQRGELGMLQKFRGGHLLRRAGGPRWGRRLGKRVRSETGTLAPGKEGERERGREMLGAVSSPMPQRLCSPPEGGTLNECQWKGEEGIPSAIL